MVKVLLIKQLLFHYIFYISTVTINSLHNGQVFFTKSLYITYLNPVLPQEFNIYCSIVL